VRSLGVPRSGQVFELLLGRKRKQLKNLTQLTADFLLTLALFCYIKRLLDLCGQLRINLTLCKRFAAERKEVRSGRRFEK